MHAPDEWRALAGKVALIDRGTCFFTDKVLAAQNAGALAVVMVNNVAGAPIVMGGTPSSPVTIPGMMISQDDGAKLKAQISQHPVVRMAADVIRSHPELSDTIDAEQFSRTGRAGEPAQAGDCRAGHRHLFSRQGDGHRGNFAERHLDGVPAHSGVRGLAEAASPGLASGRDQSGADEYGARDARCGGQSLWRIPNGSGTSAGERGGACERDGERQRVRRISELEPGFP